MSFKGFRGPKSQASGGPGGHGQGGRGQGGRGQGGRGQGDHGQGGHGQGGRGQGGRGQGGPGRGQGDRAGPSIFSPGYDAAPDTEVADIENALIKSFTGPSSTPIDPMMPRRPGFGTRGQKMVLWANSFPLAFKDDVRLYRYSVDITPGTGAANVPTGKKKRRVVQLLLENHFPRHRLDIATDFKSTLISTTDLELGEEVYQVPYRGDFEDEHAAGAPTYNVRVQSTGMVNLPALIDYLTSTNAGAMLGSKDEVIQALNIVLGHTPRAAFDIASIGSSKHFRLKGGTGEKLDIGSGLCALRGFFFSVRAATARVIVNVQVKSAAFYKEGPLDMVMRAYLQENGHSRVKLGNFLKRLSVNVTHIKRTNRQGQVVPRVKQIFGLATQQDGHGDPTPPKVGSFGAGPKDVLFYLGDPSSTEKSKKGKKAEKGGPYPPVSKNGYISVYDFFRQRYQITIKDPSLPVINTGTRQRPSYLPAQACFVLPGQPSKAKLSPMQTQNMIKFAVRKPVMNAESIVMSGLQTLGVGSEASNLGTFGMNLTPRLLAVPGRVLNSPDVKYGGNGMVRPTSGSWNMSSMKFSAASQLTFWTFLWLSYPGGRDPWKDNAALKPTVDAFTGTLRQTGINVNDCTLGQHIVVNDVDQDIDTAVKKFTASPKPPLFILVILPAADTAIYNRVKYVCDVKEGLSNICVVANKFAKPRNDQYFSNIALKLNLKLGGRNQLLDAARLGIVSEGKTMVVGLDVTHPSPGSSPDAPSVAAIVASVDNSLGQWPADLRIQPARQEMVASLDLMLRSRLDLWKKHNGTYPANILVYRDGVSEGQYSLVLENELPALRKACKELYSPDPTKKGIPRLTIAVVGKRHHHRFYPSRAEDSDKSTNPRNGTVVDRIVTEARHWDFFLQAHAAIQGTARPAHYYIIYDEIFRDTNVRLPFKNAADALEDLTHNMCYLFGRATKAVSICPPAYYADLVCERARCYLSRLFDPSPVVSPEPSVMGGAGGVSMTPDSSLVAIHDRIRHTMFYI